MAKEEKSNKLQQQQKMHNHKITKTGGNQKIENKKK